MFLSILPLGFGLILHLICLWRARTARPQGVFFFQKSKPFRGSPEAFQRLLQAWVGRHQHLAFVHQEADCWIIEEKIGIFRYGLFFHFKMQADGPEAVQIEIGVEAKLIPMGTETNWFEDLTWQEQKKDVG